MGPGRPGVPPIQLIGHTGVVNAVAFSPDGRLVGRLGRDGAAVGPGRPGVPPIQLIGHTGVVNAVAFGSTPAGQLLLASAGDDKTVRLWDPVTGAPVGSPLTGHTGVVNAVAFASTPAGQLLLASAGDDKTVRLWDPVTGAPVGSPLTGHTGVVNAVAFASTPAGQLLLASAGDDKTVRLWDPVTGAPVGSPLTGHTGVVNAVAFASTPAGQLLLASAGDDKTVRLWDPATGALLTAPPVSVPLAARVVEVITDLGDGVTPRYRYGSGCIVRGRVVLTVAHLVVGAVSFVIRDYAKREHSATVDPRFVGNVDGPGPDLALLEIDDLTFGSLPAIGLAAVDRDSATGEPVERCHAIGYPRFAENAVTQRGARNCRRHGGCSSAVTTGGGVAERAGYCRAPGAAVGRDPAGGVGMVGNVRRASDRRWASAGGGDRACAAGEPVDGDGCAVHRTAGRRCAPGMGAWCRGPSSLVGPSWRRGYWRTTAAAGSPAARSGAELPGDPAAVGAEPAPEDAAIAGPTAGTC